MRMIELQTGWRTPVSNEENLLLGFITKNNGKIAKRELDSRQQVVAKNLVVRGVLTRARESDKLYYLLKDASELWRT